MLSNYEKIRKDNIRRRGTDFDDIGNLLAEKLYGDKSHFIYELLQNAEDALALRRQQEPKGKFSGAVTFELHKNYLEVSHYGKLFDSEDVRGISDVLRGTKSERLDQIGTFGIGFKSVYAFTRSPEVHSGDEHFVIKHFIRPEIVPERSLATPEQTLFYFPFDHPDFQAEEAFNLINNRLRTLGPRSLLFLQHVDKISWSVDADREGFYFREVEHSKHGGSFVQIVGEGPNQIESEEQWFVLERLVQLPNRDAKLPIKIAYNLQQDENEPAKRYVQSLSQSPLTAYFPTARETSLKFLVHGPFASTPARDNIEKNSPWNELLLAEIATLVADSLHICRDEGFVIPKFLDCLPIDEDDFPEETDFRPIYESVREAFSKHALIPAIDGTHRISDDVVLGRSKELRKLLPEAILSELFDSEKSTITWVDPSISEIRLPKVWRYLRDECDVPVLDGEGFARRVNEQFIAQREDNWLINFYGFLGGQEAMWREFRSWRPVGQIRNKPFIRCEDGQHRSPFDSSGNPQVFLPVDSDGDYPVVKRVIYANEKAHEFLDRLGLVPPDFCTQILVDILPKYSHDCSIEDKDEDHEEDLSIIKAAFSLNESPRYAEMLRELKKVTWALGRNAADRSQAYRAPTSLFLPLPELEEFFDGNKDVWFLEETMNDVDWQHLGVNKTPVVHCKGLKVRNHGYVQILSYHGRHERGLEAFDPGTMIDGLEHAFQSPSLQKSLYLWNELLPSLVSQLHGRYQTATHQNYDNAKTREVDSELCKMLKQHTWVPVKDGGFRISKNCTVADLHSELKRNDGLIDKLGIKPDPTEVERQRVKNQNVFVSLAGFDPEIASYLIEHKDEITKDVLDKVLKAQHVAKDRQPAFPQRPVRVPERREEQLSEQINDASEKEYKRRKRSVRTTKGTVDQSLWLRNQYTNDQGQMICQICKEEMPFRKRNGEYYFVAVEALSRDHFAKEHEAQFLALCPLCAAMYNEFVKHDERAMESLKNALMNSEDVEVSLQLGELDSSVRFVESHFLDIKTIIKRPNQSLVNNYEKAKEIFE
ncbi:MAG: hypothetical protein JRE64_02965 [Deltaproteobacteria bacterium]|nr:hypothetical protein [Deltaproteobacteria bacterium]